MRAIRAFQVEGTTDEYYAVVVFAASHSRAKNLVAGQTCVGEVGYLDLRCKLLPAAEEWNTKCERVARFELRSDALMYRALDFHEHNKGFCGECGLSEFTAIVESRLVYREEFDADLCGECYAEMNVEVVE